MHLQTLRGIESDTIMRAMKRPLIVLVCLVSLSTCTSGPTFSVGGEVSGLTGELILQNNEGNYLPIPENGEFTFSKKIEDGGDYDVTVKSKSSHQECSITNGFGKLENADITNVQVSCSSNLSFGGIDADGVSSGLMLKNTSASATSVTGIYITSLDVGTSTPCFGSVVAGDNTFGVLWSSVRVPPNKNIFVDQNYLYNVMANLLYQLISVVGSTPFDTPGGSPSWCIKVGLSSGDPVGQVSIDSSPLINAIDPVDVIVTCDDETFTCEATPAIQQVFPTI